MTQSLTLPVIWLTVVLAAIFFEAIFENLIAVWFAPAAAAAFIGGVFSVSARGQVLVFVAVSVVLIVAARIIRTVYRRYLKHNRFEKNIE